MTRRHRQPENPGEVVYASMDDRDQAVEFLYHFEAKEYAERGPRPFSTLAYVSANRDRIAQEFSDWRFDNPSIVEMPVLEWVRAFERWKFGNDLGVVAHGILLAAVIGKVRPEMNPATLRRASEWMDTNPKGKAESSLEYVSRLSEVMQGESSALESPVRGFPELSPEEQAEIERARNEGR